jgi:hypothetical protein
VSFSVKRSLKAFLEIAPDATDFATHGFQPGAPSTRELLERSASTFVFGYHTALASATNATLANELEQVDVAFKGFAYEGAGMALALLDFFFPWRKRFLPFTLAEGNAHIYMLYVGWGWTMGRLPRKCITITQRTPYDPLLRWLAYDGYGFHEGFFSWRQRLQQQRRPYGLPGGYAHRAFDQGLGRSLWFVGCGDPSYITHCIRAFPRSRQPDLWSGIGLASAYAGGVSVAELQTLRQNAGPFYPHLAQGCAFAIKARCRARNPIEHTQLASSVLCGLPIDDVVSLVDASISDLPLNSIEPAFELWRQRIQVSLHIPATAL